MLVDQLVQHGIDTAVDLNVCGQRLGQRSDAEALHALRVSVRKLRSVLRPLPAIPAIDDLRAAAADVGHCSTALRDQEVLIGKLETLEQPNLVAPRRKALDAGSDALLASAEWQRLLKLIRCWPGKMRKAERKGALRRLRKRIRKKLRRQQRRLGNALRDPAYDRHQLRKLIKRVRYAGKFYPQLSRLPAGSPAHLKAAQNALGDWHDRVQWKLQAEQQPELERFRQLWQQELNDAERQADLALQPLLKDFPARGYAKPHLKFK